MIYRKIEYQLNIALVTELYQLFQVLLGAKALIYRIIICHIIFMIRRGAEYRREPYSLNAKTEARIGLAVIEIVEPLDDAPQITCSVTIGV